MIKIYGQHDDRTLAQMDRAMAAGSAQDGVLCADGHLGYCHPIGGVIGYTDHISISGVGFDIACGNMAIRLDVPYKDIAPNISSILLDIQKVVSFGVGRHNETETIEHALFDNDDLWREADVEDLKPMARKQLGTVGSGNHYVDIFEEQSTGLTWIGVHFGSRGLGHKITTKYLKAAGAKDQMEGDPALLEADSDLGRAYCAGIQLGGHYAYAGREWVVEQVRKIVGGEQTFMVHNHHNFLWAEEHHGVNQWVVRKGATPNWPGQYGFVGGSMGDDAVILYGLNNEENENAMWSTVHGAGRVMSRTEARGRFVKDEHGKKIRQPGRVRHDEWQAWLELKGVTVLGGDLDEAPQAYRRLPEVLKAHVGTIKIAHQLTPRGVIMAGNNVSDPYKD